MYVHVLRMRLVDAITALTDCILACSVPLLRVVKRLALTIAKKAKKGKNNKRAKGSPQAVTASEVCKHDKVCLFNKPLVVASNVLRSQT